MNTLTAVPGYKTLKEEISAERAAELAQIEETVVLGYTLADAMREGSKHTEQARGTYINAADNQVCALAAAGLAVKARFGA